MAFFDIIFFFLIFAVGIYLYRSKDGKTLTNWPLVGMTPAILLNVHRLHDSSTEHLNLNNGGYLMKGPWFTNMDMLITADPSDVHHVLSKNFSNYPKGQHKMFDILGDGIFNSDNELWEIHRKTTMSLFKHAKFQTLLEAALWDKVENGLLPVLEYVTGQGMETDLQEIFQRFTFDNICSLLLEYDPKSLSVDFPYIPCEKAFSETDEALLYRHIMPECTWNLQYQLGIGNEKKLRDAWKTFDQFIYQQLAKKRNELNNKNVSLSFDECQEGRFGLLSALMREFKDQRGASGDPNVFLRDTILSLMVAGRDTTSTALSWFFYLLAKNPIVEYKIREEIRTKLEVKSGHKWESFVAKDFENLVYLHGAICEVLRLFPPLPFQRKTPLRPDVLPSGHEVDQNMKIILSFYSMGRMKSVWGEDCMEFKPERWFTKGGGIKHEPSYKFPAFNAGPRTCLGKDMAFTQLKIVATTIINNYHVELVEGHRVVPSNSLLLQMKYGLKVRLLRVN